jgi:hypothetical protein
MKRIKLIMIMVWAIAAGAVSGSALTAGSTTLGVSAAEIKRVATGWSAKNQILGQGVYNDNNERVGTMDDIIIGAGQSGSYAIVGACGFLGLGSMTWRFQ